MATTSPRRPNDETLMPTPRDVDAAAAPQSDTSFVVAMSDTDDANVAAADMLRPSTTPAGMLSVAGDDEDASDEDEDDEDDAVEDDDAADDDEDADEDEDDEEDEDDDEAEEE